VTQYINEMHIIFIFFFQAEDGIRDLTVTGVQTCALPIWAKMLHTRFKAVCSLGSCGFLGRTPLQPDATRRLSRERPPLRTYAHRSEERRVGKECCGRVWLCDYKTR